MKNKKRKEFSKKLCIFSSTVFVVICALAILTTFMGVETEIWNYLIPTAGGLVSISFGFYYNKAKAENLAKQRLRTILIKLVLEGRLDEESYQELCDELDSIDNTLQEKIDEMYRNSVEEETDTNITN